MKKLLLFIPLLLLSSCGSRFNGYTHISSGEQEKQVVIDLNKTHEYPVYSYVEMDFNDLYYNDEWFIVIGDGELHIRTADINFWYIDD